MDKKVMKCRLCGNLYLFYSYMVGDQSVCPACRREAEKNFQGEWEKS